MSRVRPRVFVVSIAVLAVLAVALSAVGLSAAGGVAPAATGAPLEPATASAPAGATALLAPAVKPNDHHDTSPPLRGIPPAAGGTRQENDEGVLPHPRTVPGAVDTVVQAKLAAPRVPATATNFDGVGNGFSGPAGTFTVNAAPPDTNGDVGPNNYVQIVNTDFAVWNKSGTVIYGPVPVNTLFSGFGGGCQTNNDGDPTVKYDRIANRWIITQFSVSTTPYLECVAVSTSPDPTGTWYRYSFSYGSTNFPDYPKLAVWPDAYYVTFNMFAGGTTFAGAEACAYERAKMLTGAAASQQCFTTSTTYGGLLPSDLDGSRLPPAGSPDYLVALGATTAQLATWKFHVDWTTPASSTFSGPVAISTSPYLEACNGGTCIPQSGTTQKLDSLADRLMYRLAYRNFGDHEALVVDHSVTAGTSTGIRWYELRPDAGHNLSLFQQGTYAPDSNYRWMGSIAQDQAGNMALGFSLSGSSLHPQIGYTGRLASDALGQMGQGESSIIAGSGSQTGGLTRWGDYSSMAVDPTDDCTFWYTNEYIPSNGSFNWKTRIASFKFPSCGSVATNDFSIAAAPATLTVAAGSAGTSTITTAITSGSAETVTLAASGLPSGVTASFSPATVSAGGSSTLTLTAASSAAASSSTVTITGSATSATHATSAALTVTVPAGVPGAPTLTATRSSRRGVQLTWTVPANNGSTISAYRVYRSTTTGAEVFLIQRGTGSTSYRDTATVSGQKYFYKITAVNGVGEGPPSGEASATAR